MEQEEEEEEDDGQRRLSSESFEEIPAPPANARRYSISNKLAEVSSRLWKYAPSFGAAGSPAAPSPAAPSPARPSPIRERLARLSSPAQPAAVVPSPAASSPAEPSPAPPLEPAPAPPPDPALIDTFDDYLNAAGLNFIAASVGGRRAGSSMGGNDKTMLLSAGLDMDGSVSNQLLASCVLSSELEQLKWAAGELEKCVKVLDEGYARMEDYVSKNAPGFFASPEAQIPADDLMRLKARCAKTAKALWHDWRTTLGSDASNKLQKAGAAFEQDLSKLAEMRSQLQELAAELDAAMPSAAAAAASAALAEEVRECSATLAAKREALAEAEASRGREERRVTDAESELTLARETHLLTQAKLSEISTALSLANAPPPPAPSLELADEDLLDALQASLAQP